MSSDTQPRVVVWEPFSTYVTLRALSVAPFLVPAIMWIAAYFGPSQFNHSNTAAALARLWYRSNLLVDRFLLFPYYNHPNTFVLACLLICAVPVALFHYRTRALFRSTSSTVLLCAAGLLLVLVPLLVHAFAPSGASTRHLTWWEITALFATTATFTRHYTAKLSKHTKEKEQNDRR